MRSKRDRAKDFTRRSFISIALKTTLFGVLASRFGFLQILDSEKYSLLAQNNSVRLVVIPPFRANILDNTGKILAKDDEFYAIAIKSDSNTKDLSAMLAKIYDEKITLEKRYNVFLDDGRLNNSSYYILLKPLTIEEIAAIEVSFDSDIQIVRIRSRRYYYPSSTAHLTGYISKINDKLVAGKSGVEFLFNNELVGEAGLNKYEVNAKGKIIRELEQSSPTYGNDIILSIDANLQEIMHYHLHDKSSACVVLDASNAKVLALYSSPSFDQNIFTTGISRYEWDSLNSNYAFLNRVISSNYPPASIFKIVTALAILQSGISQSKKVFCSGVHTVGNRVIKCWKKSGHGFVDLKTAIATSCNVYFYINGIEAGIDRISFCAQELGFGAITEVELPGEVSGLVPTKSWKFKKLHEKWMIGDTVNVAIGQGYLLATPIQMATALLRLFSCEKISPSILKDSSVKRDELKIKKEHINIVKDALKMAFILKGGVCSKHRETFGPVSGIMGKTGTAQTATLIAKKNDNSLFGGVCTYNHKSYCILTMIEGGGWGSGAALPISGNIINSYLFS
ncbi:penicillin-binding protein 2 [Candidatus Cyrtobacter comes]|uniref:Penicillin-binding protein 2 n=1 Tax=Candidatus Cyrtobacter comes TaxID=675776 RepID=A0ABU5L771_9RICK|nr:penicillin-binding protein 2 [Candidatus Cyrtobacter comes]MDZ5761970.1 penicillin-binding protein 2 [Candidatus Cyrtobacter comes]